MIGSFISNDSTAYRRGQSCSYNAVNGSIWSIWYHLGRGWIFSGLAFVGGKRPTRRDVIAAFERDVSLR
jgi:hypothetical protein